MDFLLKINYYKILLKHPVAYILKYEAPRNTSTPCTSCPGTAEPTSHPTSPAQGVFTGLSPLPVNGWALPSIAFRIIPEINAVQDQRGSCEWLTEHIFI